MPVYTGDGPPRVDEDFSRLSNRSQSQSRGATNATSTNQSGSGFKFLITWAFIALIVWFVLPSYATILDTVQSYHWQEIKQKVSQIGTSATSAAEQAQKTLASLIKHQQKPIPILTANQKTNPNKTSFLKVLKSAVSTTYNSNDLKSLRGNTIPEGTSTLYYFVKYHNYALGDRIDIHLTMGNKAILHKTGTMTQEQGTARVTLKHSFEKGYYRLAFSDQTGERDVCFFTVP